MIKSAYTEVGPCFGGLKLTLLDLSLRKKNKITSTKSFMKVPINLEWEKNLYKLLEIRGVESFSSEISFRKHTWNAYLEMIPACNLYLDHSKTHSSLPNTHKNILGEAHKTR